MFDYIYDWLKNLAFYMILVTAVLQVLPDNTYQKYIRFFAGLILIVILMSPVLKLAGMQGKLEELYHSAAYRQETREMEDAASLLESVDNPLLKEGSEDE